MITAKDVDCIYDVPVVFQEEGLDSIICESLGLECDIPDLAEWLHVVRTYKEPSGRVRIAVVGKYVEFEESYKSLTEALIHGGLANDLGVDIKWVEAERLEQGEDAADLLADVGGLLVPGGFGDRGVRGMMEAIRYARVHNVPYFGICLGFQTAAMEFAENVAGLGDSADSSEFNFKGPGPGANKVIYKLRDLLGVEDLGGTMRLGAYECELISVSRAAEAYGSEMISERHRHRYEFNRAFESPLVNAGLVLSGKTADGKFVEILELPGHPWFVACQFHPEFQSRPQEPHPLFAAFVRAAQDHANGGSSRMVARAEDAAEEVRVETAGDVAAV